MLLRPAASEATGADIDEALGLSEGLGVHEAWNSIDQQIAASNGTITNSEGGALPVVAFANRVWPAQGADPDQGWLDLLASYHGADVALIDVTQADASRDIINAWVGDQTQGLIPELLPEDFINSDTTMVLTNAIYFEATWGEPFDQIGPSDFQRLDGSEVAAPFLSRELRSPFGSGDGWTAVEVDYGGRDYSMLFLVPDAGRFNEVRDQLSVDLLNEVDAALERETVV